MTSHVVPVFLFCFFYDVTFSRSRKLWRHWRSEIKKTFNNIFLCKLGMITRRKKINFHGLLNPEYLETSKVLRVVAKRGEKVSKFTFNNAVPSAFWMNAHFFLGDAQGAHLSRKVSWPTEVKIKAFVKGTG